MRIKAGPLTIEWGRTTPLSSTNGSATIKMGYPVYDKYNQQLNVDRYCTLDDIYSIVRKHGKFIETQPKSEVVK